VKDKGSYCIANSGRVIDYLLSLAWDFLKMDATRQVMVTQDMPVVDTCHLTELLKLVEQRIGLGAKLMDKMIQEEGQNCHLIEKRKEIDGRWRSLQSNRM
jgi:hypothetical protein